MDKRVGLWIDRNKAVIVSIAHNIEAKSIITSDMEHYVLYSPVVPGDDSSENVKDRRFWNHLGEYYDKIIAYIRDAAEIHIMDRKWPSMNSGSGWLAKAWNPASSAWKRSAK